jgi:WXG100 family type VII secretion target
MGNELKVDPGAVTAAADRIDTAADGLRAAHATVHERIAVAQAGWVGASAAALTAAASKWQEQSDARYTAMIGLAGDYRTAAASYVSTDEGEAADVRAKTAAMGL